MRASKSQESLEAREDVSKDRWVGEMGRCVVREGGGAKSLSEQWVVLEIVLVDVGKPDLIQHVADEASLSNSVPVPCFPVGRPVSQLCEVREVFIFEDRDACEVSEC